MNKLRTLILAISLFIPIEIVSAGDNYLNGLEQIEISVKNQVGQTNLFDAYLADSDKKRNRGLMHIQSLPKNKAMLFVFPSPKFASIWMKNTLISLDIIFIDQNQTIIKIHKYAKPLNLKSISSNRRVKWVLEINGGLADELNINAGDKIIL